MNSRDPRLGRLTLGLVAAVGVVVAARGVWIPAKATLAQLLLAAAWERAVAGAPRPPPWPSADTWPVALLHLPGKPPLVVLAGASGRTLAFGPGHVEGTAEPGEAGNLVVAGHRDTHFRALARLAWGDELLVEAPDGGAQRYRVVETAVVDHRDTRPLAPSAEPRLTLVTCWPFDAVRPGGPLRWVVVAEAVERSAPRSPDLIARREGGSRRSGRGHP